MSIGLLSLKINWLQVLDTCLCPVQYVYIYQILGTKFWEYSQTEYLKFDTHSVYVNYGRNYFVSKYLNYIQNNFLEVSYSYVYIHHTVCVMLGANI